MIPKFLYRIEFYFTVVLAAVVVLQLATLNQNREDNKLIRGYDAFNRQLVSDNKFLVEALAKGDKENEELLGENYRLGVELNKFNKKF